MNIFDIILFCSSVVASAIASVTGFGIGSILTPILALQLGTKIAVAAISIPHFIATSLRFWLVRKSINRKVLLAFGLASAVGGLIGAYLHTTFESSTLTIIFGCLLIFAGLAGITGYAQKMSLKGPAAWLAGILSGGFGGLVGNQGGIRSAALMTFDLNKESLVATATAIGVIVDLARMPVYFWTEHRDLANHSELIVVSLLGVLAGTVVGITFLRKTSERLFRKILNVLILVLGIYMIVSAQK